MMCCENIIAWARILSSCSVRQIAGWLELTRGLREAMFHHLERRSLRGKTSFFFSFIKAVRQPLLEHLEALESCGAGSIGEAPE